MRTILLILAAVSAAMVIHEGGHYLVARFFGKKLKFRFEWGRFQKIPIPRFTWIMPYLTAKWKQKAIALAGFGLELFCVPVFVALPEDFGVFYLGVVALHLIAYRFYAGDANDFSWL